MCLKIFSILKKKIIVSRPNPIKTIYILGGLERPRVATHPRKPRNNHPSGDKKLVARAMRLEAKEDHGDVRIKEGGHFQIKHPSRPH